MSKISKRYKKASEGLSSEASFELKEAVKLLKERASAEALSFSNFTASFNSKLASDDNPSLAFLYLLEIFDMFYSITSTPIDLAVPAKILQASSTVCAFKSDILVSAISSNCFLEIFAIGSSLPGV